MHGVGADSDFRKTDFFSRKNPAIYRRIVRYIISFIDFPMTLLSLIVLISLLRIYRKIVPLRILKKVKPACSL